MHELSTILFFIFPVLILLYLYISMGLTLAGSIRGVSRSAGGSAVSGERLSSRKQIIRMLAVVVIAFFLCWAPFHAQRLGYVYYKESHVFRLINEYLMYVSGITYYISSTINPILYNLMSVKYREAFRRTFCGKRSGEGQTMYAYGESSARCTSVIRHPANSTRSRPQHVNGKRNGTVRNNGKAKKEEHDYHQLKPLQEEIRRTSSACDSNSLLSDNSAGNNHVNNGVNRVPERVEVRKPLFSDVDASKFDYIDDITSSGPEEGLLDSEVKKFHQVVYKNKNHPPRDRALARENGNGKNASWL